MTPNIYDPKKTAWKALLQGAGTAALFAMAQVAADFPTDLESIKALWPSLVVGLIAAGVKAAANYIKNSGRAGMP